MMPLPARRAALGGMALALAVALAGCDTPPVRKLEDALQDLQFLQSQRGEEISIHLTPVFGANRVTAELI